MNMLHNLKQKATLPSTACLLLLWVLTVASGNFISMSVQTSSTLINMPSTYTFTLNRQFDPVNLKFNSSIVVVPIGTTILITLPSQFIAISTGSTLSCTNAANGQVLTCNVNKAARTITVMDYYSTNATVSNGAIVINVLSLINAFKAGPSDNFLWQIIAPNGTIIDTGPASGTGTSITFTPNTFQACSVTAGGATVSSYSPITLNVTPNDPIPVSGQLIVVIPLEWISDPMSIATIDASPSCIGAFNTGGSVSCSYQSSPTSQIITITSLSTSSLSSLFAVTIANVLIPPTVGSSETIYIYSQWSDGSQINTCTSRISNISSVPFQNARITSIDNTTVQSSFAASLKLTISRGFYYQDSIVLLLPDEFLHCQIASSTFASFTSTANLNSLTLTNFPSEPPSITANNIFAFTITGITNPPSTASISLTASVFRNNQLYQQQVISYAATVGTVDSFVISPANSFVQNTGRATFTISSSLYFPTGSTINIVYPISITASSIPSSSVTLASLNGVVMSTATYQVLNNQIRISNLFSSKFSGTIVVIIDSFTNPPTVQTTTYLIQVFDQAGSSVMSGSTTLTAATRAFISTSISASSYQVLKSSLTYTAAITTNFGFTSIAIIVPNDVTISAGFSATCAPSSFSSCALNGNNLTFAAPSTLPAGSYQLQWGYVTNPNSFAPTSSFQIFSYSNSFGVQSSQGGGLSIAMNTSSPFTSSILTPSSYANSEYISVTLLLTLPSNVPAGNLKISVPSEVLITSATCTGCTVSSPNIFISLPAGTLSTTVVINNVRNVGSFKPVPPFMVTLTSNAGFSSLSSSVAAWTNNQASSFSTQVVGTNNYMGQSNSLKMTLTTLSGGQNYVVIVISSSFGGLTTAPAGFTLINSNTLQIGCTGSSCNFNFGLTNPTINSSYVFTLKTYTTDDYLVGTSTSNNWLIDCFNTNCRSCNPNGTCVSCYSSSISTFFILNTFSQSCERDCAIGYFRVNTTCTICDSNCSQCVNTTKTCTSCANAYFLDTIYYLCVPQCLSGYFANALSLTCTACTQPCATCIDTSTNCRSCMNNYYLFNNSCLSTCPLNFYINNVVTRICDPCNSNCLTCSGTTTFCLTCNNTKGLYFQNNLCVATCSYNYFLLNNICTYCQAPCRICSGSTTVCSTCFLNSTLPVFFNQTCIAASQCPVGHYVDSTNSSCQVCPSSCIQCSSATLCSVCSLNLYLLGTLCIASCPNTTYFSNSSSTGICQPCNVCATCSSATACTSCIASQFLYNSKCYSLCPNAAFSTGSICTACPANCPTCTNLTYCTSCVTSMNLHQGSCYLVCPNGTFANTAAQLCESCPVRCTACTSLSSCQTCVTGYSLENSQCVLICSQGLSFNQICYPCGLNCDICVNATCSKCAPNYYLYNNTCLSQCPSNMLTLDTINCVSCTRKFMNCLTCSLDACLTCTYGQLLNGNCVPCSPGFYASSGACTSCPSTCATCDSQNYCLTCKTGNYLLQNQCFSSCPMNMIPNGTICTSCLANCNICNQVNFLCSVCSAGYYLYKNLCFSSCPDGLVVSYDFLTCTTQQKYYQQFSKAAKIVPFPFTIAAIVLVMIGVILRCFHKEMHLQTVLCAIISIIQIATWCIFLGFEYTYYSNYHKLSMYNMICAVVGIAFLFLLDFVHLRFYCKYIRDDQEFVKWVKRNWCANGSMLGVGTLLNFKFYRFVHSKFLGREQTSMVLSSLNKLTPFSMISVISIFICSLPVFIGCGLALYNSISQDQQFFIALDTITVTGIMILLLVMDLRHPDDYFVDEHEAKNLKKKVYQEDEVKFDQQFGNPMQDNVSHEQLLQIQEDQAMQIQEEEGDMALPPSANKLQSTFQKTNNKPLQEVAHLAAESKIQPNSEHYQEIGSQENIIEESQLSEEQPRQVRGKWEQKKYDHHGYLIKYDTNNNALKYDQNGHRVEIGQDGKHRKYNKDGHEMIMADGKLIAHDKDGFRIIDGKRYDNRGYQIRQQNGQLVAYDKNGFKVVGEAPNQKHMDENGYEVIIDENGKMRRQQEDGWQVVEVNGERLFKNKEGQYVRKNQQGQWEEYDPADGFTLKFNPETGQFDKYNELGLKVVKDRYGNFHYYDEDGFKVTILPGGELIRHDERGYRVEKDEDGKVRRFDEEGYELVQDSNGRPYFIDKHGYRVERDLYGRTTLYDQEGNEVRIDPQTGKQRKYNQEGLEIVTDLKGNTILVDKRGRIVKEIEAAYQKFDEQGNKIWLDDDGYEVEQDVEGKVNRYDKVGDRVDTEYQIQQSESEGILMLNNNKKLPQRFRYKPTPQVDQEAQLQKLISAPLLMEFEEDEEISELQEFHNADFPPQRNVAHEFDCLLDRERSELVFRDDAERVIEDLKEFEHKQELYGHLAQPNGQLAIRSLQKDGVNGLDSLPSDGNRQLQDHEIDRHAEFDQQFALRGLDRMAPYLVVVPLQGNSGLAEREGQQREYDQQAYVRQMDDNQPDILEIRRRDAEMAQEARKRAEDRNLSTSRAQQEIQIKSVADVSIGERSFDNEGVQPLENKTDFDEINSMDELEVPLGRRGRGNRSEVSLVTGKKDTQTVYNYNTVQVEIKNQNQLYDEEEEIESLHEEDWQEHLNPMVFSRRVKETPNNSNANTNTNILYLDDPDHDDAPNDALTDLLQHSQSKHKTHRYRPSDMLSREAESIDQIEEQLFRQARPRERQRQRQMREMRETDIRQRRQFRLSGAPNPLVQYAKTIQANKKSLQEKMYLQQTYKR